MQNAQNLMSSFEFIAALMSIIIGLGVTNLLAGAGRAFYRRKENPLDEVHIVLTLATLLLLVLQWWVTFKWNTEVTWSFDRFLVLIVWTITLYMLTVFLYPPDLSEAEEHHLASNAPIRHRFAASANPFSCHRIHFGSVCAFHFSDSLFR